MRGKGYDLSVDYWAIGVLLFELLAGYSPFVPGTNGNTVAISRNILKVRNKKKRTYDIVLDFSSLLQVNLFFCYFNLC